MSENPEKQKSVIDVELLDCISRAAGQAVVDKALLMREIQAKDAEIKSIRAEALVWKERAEKAEAIVAQNQREQSQ